MRKFPRRNNGQRPQKKSRGVQKLSFHCQSHFPAASFYHIFSFYLLITSPPLPNTNGVAKILIGAIQANEQVTRSLSPARFLF